MVDVYEAVLGRRSVRGFLDRAVERGVLERALRAACQAPSGGNLQPWRIFVLSGEALTHLKKLMSDRIKAGTESDGLEYPIYPPNLASPYRERRYRCGEHLYGALGIAREDKPGRLRQFSRNYEFFDAPVGLFCYVDRRMGAAQWADLGMFLQSLMLLLRAEGLASCPQEAWAAYHRTVADVVRPPDELMLFCGMAIGYENPDHPANTLRTERAPLDEVAEFLGWDT